MPPVLSRSHLIAAAVTDCPPAWAGVLERALECSPTWLPWLALYHDRGVIGYEWLANQTAAVGFGLYAGPFDFLAVIDMRALLYPHIDDALGPPTGRLDWDRMLDG